MLEQEPVTVFVAQGELEEDQIRAFLAAHGIRTSVRGEALRRTHAMVLDGLGQVKIQVLPEDAEAARELLASAERGELALEDESED